KRLIYYFDHDAGEWRTAGTVTVSVDGKTLVSDPGAGIRTLGWRYIPKNPSTPATPCPPHKPEKMVDPVPFTNGLEDHFFKDDQQKFNLTFRNDAEKINPNQDPCSEENRKATAMVVEIDVDGQASTFLQGLQSDTFMLLPKEERKIEFNALELLPK